MLKIGGFDDPRCPFAKLARGELAVLDQTSHGRRADGECRGRLSSRARGSGGFGYDPAFVPDELPAEMPADTTMAELNDQQKDAISHRGRAARALAKWLLGAGAS